MSTAKRRINSTGRRKIARECIDIRMLESIIGEPLSAKAALDLSAMTLPASAAVAIEAYHRSSAMRFDCGTVGELRIPSVLLLDQVDRSGSVLFRVKIVDNDNDPGRLLASAERIQPRSEDEGDGRRSLFPILYRDLGSEIWKVEINYGDRPKLILNTRLPGFSHKLQENPLLQGLLLPAAFREVLDHLVEPSDTGDDVEGDEGDTGTGWKEEWLQYARDELGMSDIADSFSEEQRQEWVDEAIVKFCEKGSFITRIRKMAEEV